MPVPSASNLNLWKKQLGMARARRQAVWYGIWSEFFRQQYAKAVSGQGSAQEALSASAEKWNQLKKQYSRDILVCGSADLVHTLALHNNPHVVSRTDVALVQSDSATP